MITMGSQILKVVIDFDKLVNQGFSYKIVLAKLGSHTGEYNPYMLEALETFQEDESKKKIQIKKMMINELRSGLIAEEDIVAKNKVLLVQRGQEITYTVLIRLHNFNKGVGIVEPVSVQIISQTVNKTDII